MTEGIWTDKPGSDCPKRPWVMASLSDDEVLEKDGSAPAALQLHLSTCPSCHALADRLLRVGDGLRALSLAEAPEGLQQAADEQAREALRAGARFSGRVDIPDETAFAHRSNVRSWTRYSVAAAIAIALVGISQVITSQGPTSLTESGGGDASAPVVVIREPSLAQDGLDVERVRVGDPADRPTLVASDSGAIRGKNDAPLPRCRHRSAIEAANCERTDCVHNAMIIPLRGGRRPEPLDKSRNAVSIPSRSNDR